MSSLTLGYVEDDFYLDLVLGRIHNKDVVNKFGRIQDTGQTMSLPVENA